VARSEKFLIAIVEVLREFFGNFGFARWGEL
jgi:hypothetical protein